MSDPAGWPQETADSDGRPPTFAPGARVGLLQEPWRGVKGTVERQMLHYDGFATFWGNVVVVCDGGKRVLVNSWQVEAVDG